MTDRARIRLLAGALAAIALPALSGCAGPYYDAPPPPYPPYYYDYYYYPHVDVYYHIYTGYYWYRDGPTWRRAIGLPRHIYLHPRYRVSLRVQDEHPYRYHKEHRRQYPPPPQARPPVGRPSHPPAVGTRGQPDWQARDREERQHNVRQYETYRKKPWVAPK